MNNYAIARVFSRIADLMELRGDNAFKIRAYRTAAQTMEETTESLEVLAERGELHSVPGVGDAIAGKTEEILATGTCRLLEELKREVPDSLTELLNLPGFGVKKVQATWKGLGVRNLDDLERVAADGQLRTLPGFSVKTEANLLQAIAGVRRRRERTPIGRALPYAEGLIRLLQETGRFESLELAGSLRRRQDLVDDIDLVGVAKDGEAAAAVEAVATHAEVREVLAREDGCLEAATEGRFRLDLRVVESPAELGTALLRATGSGAHWARLEALATERGGTLEGASEEAIYASLGLASVPPELREDRGEIEAAGNGTLPNLIEVADIRGALHAHSTWSDGSVSVAEMARTARELGHAYLAITDHSKAMGITGGLDAERLAAQMAEIEALNSDLAASGTAFRVLRGIECDVLADGTLDLPLDLLARLDFVIASLHLYQRQDRDTITARAVRAIESGVVHLLAHPTGRILGIRDPSALDLDPVMDAALKHNVALEINAFPDRLDLNEIQARAAKERGIPISINPDAHRPEHLSLLRYGIWQARRAWLEPEDVINTWPLDRLQAWLPRQG